MQIDPHPNKVHITDTPAPSWRDVLKIHPAAELFPLMPPDELKKLGADIKKNGLRMPTVWWRDPSTDQLYLLDGRNRLDAMEAAGRNVIVGGTPGQDVTDLRGVLLNSDYWYVLPPCGPRGQGYPDPYAYVISANIHRRHLTAEQKRELIAKLLKATPGKSDRQIAETVKASPTFVGKVRAEKEAAGDVSTVDTRTDRRGRAQPAHKPKAPAGDGGSGSRAETKIDKSPAPEPAAAESASKPRRPETKAEDALVKQIIDAGYKAMARKCHPDTGGSTAAMQQLNELHEGLRQYLVPEFRQHVKLLKKLNDLEPDNTAQLERLRARNQKLESENQRLQRENIALRSQVEELRTQAPPGDPGPQPASLRREAAS